MTLYKPTEDDITWARNTVSLLKEGGIWGCSWGTYRVSQKDKNVELLTINSLVPIDILNDMLHKTEQTFDAIGYKVTRRTE